MAVMLFFAGGALSALGGDIVAPLLDQTTETTPVSAPASESSPPISEPAQTEPVAPPVPEEAENPSPVPPGDPVAPLETEEPTGETPAEQPPAGDTERSSDQAQKARSRARQKRSKDTPRTRTDARAADEEAVLAPTLWVRRDLPEPISARRLTSRSAKRLARVARRSRVDWALLLAVDRIQRPAGDRARPRGELVTLADRLARLGPRDDPRRTLSRLSDGELFADRVIALARYYRVVGMEGVTRGLDAAKPRLVARLLDDPRIDLTTGGRADILLGRLDVRVLALIAYLAEAHGQVTVSNLVTGHKLYARSGVVSAHIYGRAVDISSLGGVPIAGHQEPGGITDRAIQDLLLLPAEVRPRQVISLLGLGGPSFPLGDHADHIHVGY